jgi:thiol:disulfide interchange protein DsbD
MHMAFRQVVGCMLGLVIAASGAAAQGNPDPFALENERVESRGPLPPKVAPKPAPGNQKLSLTAEKLQELVQFELKISPAKARPGEVIKLEIRGKLKPDDAYTYPVTKRHPEQAAGGLAKLGYKVDGAIKPLFPIFESEPELDAKEKVLKYTKDFVWAQEFYVAPDIKPGTYPLEVKLRMQVCSKKTGSCYGPENYPPFAASVEVIDAPAVAAPADLETRLTPGGKTTADTGAVSRHDLWGLLGAAFLGAFLMLLTPCVFPMIPITVNFFIKQSEKEHHRPFFMASVYSLTIIFTLTLVMLLLGNVVVWLANDPWFNLVLGAVLVYFALSLFGMYEIELPTFLARFTSAREGRGGMVGTIFMALTFTITSFTCTGPFLGIMLAPVAGIRPPLINLVLAALVYSATFAAPFFVLALFPTVLKRLPKSGGWMNAIKVTMGFLEIGAALKFLGNTDIAWNPGDPRLFNFDTVLCAWIALALATGLYLFGVYRLPHDDPAEHIGVMRMIFASLFIGMAVYMTPVLFGLRPKGVVMDSIIAFLPPQLNRGAGFAGGPGQRNGEHLSWHLDYADAWKEATKENKLLFIDFTGVNCTNCRYNEENVFPRTEVIEELKKYVRVQLYTDTVPNPKLSAADAKKLADLHTAWRDQLAKEPALPTYLIFEPAPDQPLADDVPKGRVVDRRNGQIFNTADFIRFLRDPIKGVQTASK